MLIKNNSTRINPLLPNISIFYCIFKISIKKKRDQEKNSCKRRAYESIDYRSLS